MMCSGLAKYGTTCVGEECSRTRNAIIVGLKLMHGKIQPGLISSTLVHTYLVFVCLHNLTVQLQFCSIHPSVFSDSQGSGVSPKMFAKSSAILLVCLIGVVISTPNEEPCSSNHGTCQMSSETCPGDFRVSMCPSQPSSILCCVAPELPYEEPCRSNGGRCQYTTQSCSGGTYRSSLCPSQPAGVRCCVQNYGSGQLSSRR